jgi:hypothetical protein
MGFIMGFSTCGLWNPFAAAPERKSPLPGPRIPFAPEFGVGMDNPVSPRDEVSGDAWAEMTVTTLAS